MLTLRFGEECSQVVQTSTHSVAADARAIRALDVEIDTIEDAIEDAIQDVIEDAIGGIERWETIRITRDDELHGGGRGREEKGGSRRRQRGLDEHRVGPHGSA